MSWGRRVSEHDLFQLLVFILGLFVLNDVLNPWGNTYDLRYYLQDLAIYSILLFGLYQTRRRRHEKIWQW